MREYRGFGIDAKRWHTGFHFIWKRYGKSIHIIGEGVQNGSVNGFKVHPDSVGQFIGRYDVTGKKLYDGQRVRFELFEWDKFYRLFDGKCTGTIRFDEEDACYYVDHDNDRYPHVKFQFIDKIEIEYPDKFQTEN